MDLVDRDRARERVALAARAQPRLVGPLVRAARGRRTPSWAGPRSRRPSGRPSGGSRRRGRGSRTCSGRRARRRAGRAPRCRWSRASASGAMRPSQKLKSPTTETGAAAGAQTANAVPAHALELEHVRAEALPQLLVAALADQVQVELADRGQEAVRVLGRDGPVAVVDLVAVGERQLRARDAALEDAAGVDLLERDGLAALPAPRPTAAAAGRQARTTTPSPSGCAPR